MDLGVKGQNMTIVYIFSVLKTKAVKVIKFSHKCFLLPLINLDDMHTLYLSESQ